MSIERDKERFLQRKFLEQMLRDIPIMEMVSVYSQTPRGESSCGVFCALVPNSAVADCLKDFSWDLSTGDGTPGAMTLLERRCRTHGVSAIR